MYSAYIVSNKGRINRENELLVFWDGNSTKKTLYPFNVDQIVIIGACEVTNSAIKLILKYKIDTVFLNSNGRFAGRLTGNESKNIFLRKKQYKLTDDKNFRSNFAKKIVEAKMSNQLLNLKKISKKCGLSKVKKTISKFKKNINSIENATTLESLRGIEGYGAKLYFGEYRYAIDPSWARFNGRSMNPPGDNVNAVLSFLYTLIMHRVTNAILLAGLDPYAGFFHSLGYGKTTLAFDLMEEYRVPLGDMITSSLFNLFILSEDDFREEDFSSNNIDYPLDNGNSEPEIIVTEKKGVLLTKNALKKVIEQFERKLNSELYYPESGERETYKDIIKKQALKCKKVVSGELEFYSGLKIR